MARFTRVLPASQRPSARAPARLLRARPRRPGRRGESSGRCGPESASCCRRGGCASGTPGHRHATREGGGNLYLALNLGFLGLTQSRTRSLLDGLAPQIRSACEKAIDIDGTFDAGGAYRFLGKFLMTAPWPVRDMERAEAALRKANEIAEVPQNHLILGSLFYLNDRLEQAREAWPHALATPSHPSTEIVDAAVHELARRRLAASGG